MAVETAAGARQATAMPMSPWASDSLISTVVVAERCSTAPPSSSGTPIMVRPSWLAWVSSSGGAAQAVSASSAAGRRRSEPNSRTESRRRVCSSDGVRSNRSAACARGWRAGRESRCAAANVRPAVAAVRAPVFEAPWMRLVTGSRSPSRSIVPDEATRLSARSPTAIPRSAMFGGDAISLLRYHELVVTSFHVMLNVGVYLTIRLRADVLPANGSYGVLTVGSSCSFGARTDRRGRAPTG